MDYTLEQAAKKLGVGVKTLKAYIYSGRIPYHTKTIEVTATKVVPLIAEGELERYQDEFQGEVEPPKWIERMAVLSDEQYRAMPMTELSEYLGLAPRSIYNYIAKGVLPARGKGKERY